MDLSRSSSSEEETTVSVLDLKNKFIAYSETFASPVTNIIDEWNEIFIITSDKMVHDPHQR